MGLLRGRFRNGAACSAGPPWADWTVAAYLVVLLGIAVFYYPLTFTAEKQTLFGWFENDVYVGLLVSAFVLQVLRLRGVSLVTRR